MNKAFEKILERLEKYENNDLIEHDSELCEHCKRIDCGIGMDCSICVMDKAQEIVQEVAREYNNGWIPCSERLPELKTKSFGNKQKRTNVLVTLRNGVVKEMTYEFATKEFWEAGDENHIEHWKEDYNGNDIEVIAWMPLPEPYKEND